MALFVFILFLLLIVYGLLIDYYRRAWNAIPEYGVTGMAETPVSVVIAVRNEQENISPLFTSLDNLEYPRHLLELIIVDDHSEDNTWEKLAECKPDGLNMLFLRNPGSEGSKKSAIVSGISSASGKLIITTDADCRFQRGWINAMASFYEEKEAKFIAAPVNMAGSGSVLSVFQCLDFITLQGITGASVHKRFHTMCNGANLAYEKKAFFEAGGFEGIDNIPSGDDMLLMHKIYKLYPEKVFYLKNADATVTTKTEPTWKRFFQQRIRWASKAVHYEDKRIYYVLLLVYLMNLLLAGMAVVCIWHSSYLFLFVLLILGKTLIEFPFVQTVAAFFGRQTLMKYFALLQPLHIMYTIAAGWLGRFGSYEWKLRRIKNTGR